MILHLFNGFALHRGDLLVTLPLQVRRLIALVALQTTIGREQASGMLWPDVPDWRAAARLRSTLWRLRQSACDLVRTVSDQLLFADGVDVDVRNWIDLALRVVDRPECIHTVDLASLRLGGDLLPGWYDDWILLERERVRQLQLHVFETAADQLLQHGRHAAALEFALRALRIEQTRESAHRLVIRVHLAEGNTGEAWRQFERCEHLLSAELGVRPSGQLQALLTGQPIVPTVEPRAVRSRRPGSRS
jgi:DNA-binding SARP family transcriptional activator